MTTVVSQITSLAVVYSIVYSDEDEGKHQSSASLAFVPVNSPHKGPVTQKMFPFDEVIMQSYKFKEYAKISTFWILTLCMRHTFWGCLIRCANMKWIRRVLLKIQSGHDSVHRQTDGQTDKVKPVYPPFNFVEVGGIIKCSLHLQRIRMSYWFVTVQKIFMNLFINHMALSILVAQIKNRMSLYVI